MVYVLSYDAHYGRKDTAMDDVKLSDAMPTLMLRDSNIRAEHKLQIEELHTLLAEARQEAHEWKERMTVYKNECESNERKTITDQMIIEFLSKQIPNVDALLIQFMRNEYADLLGATI